MNKEIKKHVRARSLEELKAEVSKARKAGWLPEGEPKRLVNGFLQVVVKLVPVFAAGFPPAVVILNNSLPPTLP